MPKEAVKKGGKKTTKANKTWSCSNHRSGYCDVFRSRKIPDHTKTKNGYMICKSCHQGARTGFISEDPVKKYGSKEIAGYSFYHGGDVQVATKDAESGELKGIKRFSIKFKKNGEPVTSSRYGSILAYRRSNSSGGLEEIWLPPYRRMAEADVMALDA